MVAVDFPSNPTLGDQYVVGNITWTWDGFKWTAYPGGLTITDAPSTGALYGRQSGIWAIVPPASTTPPLMDGTAAVGTGTAWASGDHIHPSDTTKYNVSNPSGYQTAAQVTASLGGYLPLAGGTLTGALTGTLITAGIRLGVDGAAGTGRNILGSTSGAPRWQMRMGDATAESGSNAGSDFNLARYTDAGAQIDTPIQINRASGIVTIPALSAPQALGDNRIINGDMRIDARNSGAGGTATNVYTVDRWIYSASQTSKGTWGRGASTLALNVGFGYFLKFTSAATGYSPLAGDGFYFAQPIEADVVTDFAWQTSSAQPVTLSFWALSSVTGTFSGCIFNYAANRSYPFTYTITATNVFQKSTITIPGDTGGSWVMNGNAGSMWVCFDLGSGATFRGASGATAGWTGTNLRGVTGTSQIVALNNASLSITGVKLEIGSVATPYNRQSLAKSMADCQRYYAKTYLQSQVPGVASADNNALTVYGGQTADTTSYVGVVWNFPVLMRAAPTVTIYSPHTGVSGKAWGQNTALDLTAAVQTSSDMSATLLLSGQNIVSRDLIKFHATVSAEL